MKSSFFVNNEDLQKFQTVVKAYDLRFVSVLRMDHRSYVCISTEDVEKYNDFHREWNRYTTSIVEKIRPLSWKRRIAKFFGI